MVKVPTKFQKSKNPIKNLSKFQKSTNFNKNQFQKSIFIKNYSQIKTLKKRSKHISFFHLFLLIVRKLGFMVLQNNVFGRVENEINSDLCFEVKLEFENWDLFLKFVDCNCTFRMFWIEIC